MEHAIFCFIHDNARFAGRIIPCGYAHLPFFKAHASYGNDLRAELGEPVNKLGDESCTVRCSAVLGTGQKAGFGDVRSYDISLFYKAAEALCHGVVKIGIIPAVICHGWIYDDERVVTSQKINGAL